MPPRLQPTRLLLLAALVALFPWRAPADGFETFAHYPVTANSYSNGTFLGQDGSIWTYSSCQGSEHITAPTPGLGRKKTPLAYIESGVIAGGCGTISFDRQLMFNPTVRVDVIISGTLRHTVTGGVKDVAVNSGPLVINQGGNFTLRIQQHDFHASQVAIDNIAWTSYGGSDPEPPSLLFSPDTNRVLSEHSRLIELAVRATEPNEEPDVRLWATGVPAGAAFNSCTGAAPLIATFAWTPVETQTGSYDVVFYASDKDGTTSRPFSIEVTPIYPYYHYAEGLTGTALKAKLHEIISTDTIMLDDNMENDAMRVLHTDPANTNNVLLLYNPTSSVPMSAYNANTDGWNKEHCWPESRGLGNDGPDQVDVHNLYAADKDVNGLRGNLYFDQSDSADPGYQAPATHRAPLTSLDSDSFEPPRAAKGNVARAVLYMATRYDGNEDNTNLLQFSGDPSHTNTMGLLSTLLLWHALDPPDDAERERNNIIFTRYQRNRNPFIDRPEWAEAIWGIDSDNDGITDTHERIAGTATNDPLSRFEASLAGANLDFEVSCARLTTGSIWRLYQGQGISGRIVWHQVAQTNRLQSGVVRFPIAATNAAAFYHLRATLPP